MCTLQKLILQTLAKKYYLISKKIYSNPHLKSKEFGPKTTREFESFTGRYLVATPF